VIDAEWSADRKSDSAELNNDDLKLLFSDSKPEVPKKTIVINPPKMSANITIYNTPSAQKQEGASAGSSRDLKTCRNKFQISGLI